MKNPSNPIAVCGRLVLTGALFVTACAISQGQVAPSEETAAKRSADDETLELSVFTVKSTAGKGYASRAAVGLKNNVELMKTPQAVTMVTSDFIEDLGYNDTARTLQYAGVYTAFGQESLSIRGTRIGNALLDEMPEGSSPADNVNIDSIVVLRGPAATLYRGASLGGLVLKNSKWPLAQPRNTLTVLMDQHGLYRSELDSTGPLGERGEAKFGYRLTAALQEGNMYFRNVRDDRRVLHPTFQLSYKGTLVRLAADYQHIEAYPSPNNIVTPDGGLYTGAGRRESYFPLGGNRNDEIRRGLKLIVEQRISNNWSAKFSSESSRYTLFGPVAFVSAVNWPAQTMSFQARLNSLLAVREDAQIDINGKYNVGKIPMQTIFGGVYNRTQSANVFIGSTTFGTVTVPIANPQMNLIRNPVASEYNVPLSSVSRGLSYNGNAYVQQTVEIIPNRLTLVGGLTYQKLKTNQVSNLATMPPAVTTEGAKNLHRYGIVFNLTKNIMLYASESTTFTPSSPFNIDINGNVLPGPEGKGREAGFKTSFLGGRFSSTFSVFNIELTNQAFFAGIRPDGVNYFVPIGTTTQKGFDFDITASPLPNLEFVATYYDGDVVDQADAVVPNSYKKHISVVGRYKLTDGAFKGLTVGAGYTHVGGRNMGRGSYNTGLANQGAIINLKDMNLVNAFASYRVNNSWLIRANIENLLDEVFVASGQLATTVVPSMPRTVSTSVTYEF